VHGLTVTVSYVRNDSPPLKVPARAHCHAIPAFVGFGTDATHYVVEMEQQLPVDLRMEPTA
jgi:hypothetical protein